MNTTLPEMPCQELVELITDYLEDTLSPRDRRRFEAHLIDCPFCMEYLEQIKAVIAGARRLQPEDIPPATRAALLEAFRDWAE